MAVSGKKKDLPPCYRYVSLFSDSLKQIIDTVILCFPNTIYTQFKLFRTLTHEAEKANRIKQNPFNVFTVFQEKTVKEKLTKEEIDRMLKLDLVVGSVKWHSRNVFM